MKPRYSNNRSAPRMKKAKFSKRVITRELYNKFNQQFPEHNLSWEEFYNNWMAITERIRYEAINNPLGIKLGSYMGELKVQYLPYKKDTKDEKGSDELGGETNHLNFHSRGRIAVVKWERRQAVRYNKILQFYAFDPTRELQKGASKYVMLNAEKLRISRVTLGGISFWRQKLKK